MPAGRPRAFNADEALDEALRVFWRKGYDGTSVADLTQAMGINRPSLYAAFGNKESLFRKAMERYIDVNARHVRDAVEQPTARQVVVTLFNAAIRLIADPKSPRGCFLVQSALACGDSADPVRREMIQQRTAAEALLRHRFEQARQEGDLPDDADPAALARYVMSVTYGMAVQAASGASAKDLTKVAWIALQAF